VGTHKVVIVGKKSLAEFQLNCRRSQCRRHDSDFSDNHLFLLSKV